MFVNRYSKSGVSEVRSRRAHRVEIAETGEYDMDG